MIPRLIARLLLLLAVTFFGWANTHTTAVAVPSPGAASYTYENLIPNEPTDYAASERGPPMQLVTSVAAAVQVVVHWSDDTSARPNLNASVVTCNYDCAPQFVRVVHGDNTGEQLMGASIGNLSALQSALAAANGAARMPSVIRAGELKLSGVPKGAVGTPVRTGKGLEYPIPRGTPELDPRVASIRVMDPVTTGKYQYPNGYVSYMNSGGQVVNPLTGKTLQPSDPL